MSDPGSPTPSSPPRRSPMPAVLASLVGLAAVGGLVVVAFLASRPAPEFVPPPPSQVGGTVTSAVHQGSECSTYPQSQAISCLENYVEAAGHEGKFKPVLAELDSLLKDPQMSYFARPACHSATHALGRIAFEKAGSVPQAFDLGDSTCNMGFYHGVVEALGSAVETAEDLNRQVATVCSSFPAGERFQVCAHGVGHAAMAANDGDLQGSLATCAAMRDAQAEEVCDTGVFMEWTNRFAAAGGVASADPRTESLDASLDGVFPPGLCRSMRDPARKACFNELFQTLSGVADQGSLEAAARWCGDGDDASMCVAGLGTRLPFILDGDHGSSMTVCQQAASPSLAEECMAAYGASWASYTHDEGEIGAVCDALPRGFEQVCERIRREAGASSLVLS